MGEIEVANPQAVETALVDGTELPLDETSDDVARAIVLSILAAPDVESVFATFEAEGVKEYLDRPLEIRSVKWNRSSFEEGPPVFAVLDTVVLDSGEAKTLTCGGRSIMAALFAFGKMGAYPIAMKIIESPNPTPEGYRPYRIQRISDADAAIFKGE